MDDPAKPFVIPSLVPSLPTSSVVGKENECFPSRKSRSKSLKEITNLGNEENEGPLNKSTTKLQPSGGNRTPQTDTHESHFRHSSAKLRSRNTPFSTPPSSHPSSVSKHRPILRYGETTETLFCLTLGSTGEHRSLSKCIADGTLADNASSWRRVLELATNSASSQGSDLVKLHRRATIRFPADRLNGDEFEDVLAIWLSFALVLGKNGSLEEARRTYRHIENQRGDLPTDFFCAFADLERKAGNGQAAHEILHRGNTRQAKPLDPGMHALKVHETQMKENRPQIAVPRLESTGKEEARSPRKRASDGTSSPKRLKTSKGFIETHTDAPQHKCTTEADRKTSGSTSLAPKPRDAIKPRILKSRMKTNHGQGLGFGKAKQVKLPSEPSDGLNTQKRLSSRLSRRGLSGKAKRIDPEMSFSGEPDSEDDTVPLKEAIADVGNSVAADNNKVKLKKFKKLDLSYMWEWDPAARGKPTEATARSDEGSIHTESSKGNTEASNMSEVTAASSAKKHSARAGQQTHEKSTLTNTDGKSPTQPVSEASSGSSTRDKQALDLKKMELVEKANMEFLPLVHQDNILTVNGTSYAKLGVIGKGGSCKVYRALSKKCSVVAIKKVKLDGMDKKAVEGYANEISLLKRLRGNPAIIQMYDSEVDVERKSIFVVMELGEVDLNHVLQQRAQSGTCRAMNMNFIRLTWQQMLSAVHCIHEERIIHSDLKPANFLFVRGALKLIDFGIAKAIQSDDTTNIYRESHIGTLNYMSPEAILDTGSGQNGPRMKIGRASDVWSLGCILYEMVFGRTPFATLHFIQKLQAIVNPNHKIKYPEEADECAVDAIQNCLQRNPDERPPIMGHGGLLNEHPFLQSNRLTRQRNSG